MFLRHTNKDIHYTVKASRAQIYNRAAKCTLPFFPIKIVTTIINVILGCTKKKKKKVVVVIYFYCHCTK